MFKNYLRILPTSAQVSIFIGLWVAFMLLNTVLQGVLLQSIWNVGIDELDTSLKAQPQILLFLNFIQQLLLFGAPALIYAYLADPSPTSYLGFKKKNPLLHPFMILAIAVLLIPFISSMGGLIKLIDLGTFANKLQEGKDNYISSYLKDSSFMGMLLNLFLMALVPAICEELFFRGMIMKILLNINKNPWLAFILTSLFFAVLHSSVYDFLPVFSASMLLCSIYYFTGNILNAILIHFLNNSLQVLIVYFIDDTNTTLPYEQLILAGSFLITAAGLFFIFKKLYANRTTDPNLWNMQYIQHLNNK